MRPRNPQFVKKLRIFAACLAGSLAVSVTACSAPEPVSEESNSGAPNFVSLNPCTDAILAEIADPDQVLALSHYSSDADATSLGVKRAAQFGITGGTLEEVLALQPDIVLAGSFMAPATKNALERLGLDPVTFGIASDVKSSAAQIRQIAELAGHKARGEALIARIDDALAPDKERKQVSAVLWQPGQIVPGKHALVSQLMTAAGFSNHAAAIGMEQADYLSLEQLLAHPPEVLLIAGDAPAQNHDVLSKLSDTYIASFDPALLYCAGPTIIRAIERLRSIRAEAA